MKNFTLLLLIVAAFLERTFLDLGPNIELITTVVVVSTMYVGGLRGSVVVLVLMVASDMVLGNTSIAVFTWSGLAIPALAFGALKHIKAPRRRILLGTAAGLGANIFFFVWTNFGVWLLDAWGMYPDTFGGLAASYVNGLPFLRNQLASSIYFLPLTIALLELVPSTLSVPLAIKRRLV